jgi:hypothetical protein
LVICINSNIFFRNFEYALNAWKYAICLAFVKYSENEGGSKYKVFGQRVD